MYTVKKRGAVWQALDSKGLVHFSSLTRSNVTRFVQHASETQHEKEARFCMSEEKEK